MESICPLVSELGGRSLVSLIVPRGTEHLTRRTTTCNLFLQRGKPDMSSLRNEYQPLIQTLDASCCQTMHQIMQVYATSTSLGVSWIQTTHVKVTQPVPASVSWIQQRTKFTQPVPASHVKVYATSTSLSASWIQQCFFFFTSLFNEHS